MKKPVGEPIKKGSVTIDIQKYHNGMYYCQLTDREYPYGSALGWGKDEVEAEMNAWSLRKQILEKQLKTNPTMAIPVESYAEAKERLKL